MSIELGPFLCKPSTTSMGFWISATNTNEVSSYSILLWPTAEGKSQARKITFGDVTKHYSTSIATAEKLMPNTQYSYELCENGAPIYLGLQPTAFTFRTLSEKEADLEILLMSCHGIEAYQQDAHTNDEDTWNMWHRLLHTIKERPNCRIGLLGGDQVYMDDTFGEDLNKFDPTKPDEAQVKVFAAYKKYWSEPAYREVMARIPCFLMWDDHDIIDGWGSREEQFGRDKQKWKIYGEVLYRAFEEMQASRNSGVLSRENGYSFLYQTGPNAVLGLDLRNTRTRQSEDSSELEMLSVKAKQDIEQAIKGLSSDVKNLFILSPVTLARMGSSIEFFLGSLSNFMWELMKWGGYGKTFKRMVLWTLIFSVCYLILYIDLPELQGTLQSLASFTLVFIFTVGNWGNLTKYFPRGSLWVKLALGAILSGTLGRIGYVWLSDDFSANTTVSAATAWSQAQWASITTNPIQTLASYLEWLMTGPIDTKLGLSLSVLTIGFFGFAKSKSIQKWIGDKLNLKKDGRANLAKVETGIGALLLVALAIINWWRGLPGEHASWAILSYAIFGFITFAIFLVTMLEATGTINMVAGLNDDVLDSWSADEHQGDLRWLLAQIKEAHSNVRRVHLLCGDIHTGGLSNISFGEKNDKLIISQITSSPISYVTMPPLVEKLTSGIGEVYLIDRKKKDGAKVICSVNNVFFRSNRNFVILKTSGATGKLEVEFYFEDLIKPVCLSIS